MPKQNHVVFSGSGFRDFSGKCHLIYIYEKFSSCVNGFRRKENESKEIMMKVASTKVVVDMKSG